MRWTALKALLCSLSVKFTAVIAQTEEIVRDLQIRFLEVMLESNHTFCQAAFATLKCQHIKVLTLFIITASNEQVIILIICDMAAAISASSVA